MPNEKKTIIVRIYIEDHKVVRKLAYEQNTKMITILSNIIKNSQKETENGPRD